MRRLLLPALLLALAPDALAQGARTVTVDTVVTTRTVVEPARAGRSAPPPTPRRATRLLLPNGRGVFYVRYGEPGGVRRQARGGRPAADAGPAGGGTRVLQPIVVRGGADGPDGVTRRDLDRLRDVIDDRLDDLRRDQRLDRDDLPPPRTPLAPSTGRPAPPAVGPPVTGRPGNDVVTVEEVERALLDTGLFATTRVNFEFGEATLIPASREVTDAIADVLRRYPDLRVRVGGHTDSVSSDAFNLRLSQERAQAIVDYLVGAGVDADRLVAVGYGERDPVASNETETGRALNRRVEFTVLNPEAAETVRRSTTTEAEGVDRDRVREILREELDRLRREGDDG